MAKQNNVLIWVVVLGVLAGLFLNNNQTFSIVNNAESQPYSTNDTFLNYNILKSSSLPFGTTILTPDTRWVETYIANEYPGEFKIGVYINLYDPGAGNPKGIENYATTTDLTIEPDNTEKIMIDFSHVSSLSGCQNTREAYGNSGIYLYDLNTLNTIALYEPETLRPSTTGAENINNKAGRITIYKNQGIYLLDINGEVNVFPEFSEGGPYGVAMYSNVREQNCGSWTEVESQTQEISISNIQVELKQNNTLCSEDWQCGDWSACSNSQQTRTCIDLNSCGTVEDKPEISQSCSNSQQNVSITCWEIVNEECLEKNVSVVSGSNCPSQYYQSKISCEDNLPDGPNYRNTLILISLVGIGLGLYIWRKKK